MNGKDVSCDNFASSFRKFLMVEHLHLGKDESILDDPLSDELWSLMQSRARSNTLLYRDIFRCYPDDEYKSFKALGKYYEFGRDGRDLEILRKKYKEKSGGIVGHVVEFPLHFLEDEKLGKQFMDAYFH